MPCYEAEDDPGVWILDWREATPPTAEALANAGATGTHQLPDDENDYGE